MSVAKPQTAVRVDGTPPVDAALLRVSGLSVAFPGAARKAVSELDFEIRPAERVALVGESGAGKTVTALAIIGLLAAQATRKGKIFLAGSDLTLKTKPALAALRGSHIGMIFQDPVGTLNPVLSIGSQLSEVVALQAARAGSALSRHESKQRALGWLERVGLRDPKLYACFPHELSGGMSQRVGIALALVGRPELLIADEPTTALDATSQREIMALLLTLQAELRLALLLITHDFGVVAQFAERALLLHAGRIVESAPVDAFFHEPAHPYTRALLASLPGKTPRGRSLPTLALAPERATPVACSYAARCPDYHEACSREPALVQLGAGHEARCWRAR